MGSITTEPTVDALVEALLRDAGTIDLGDAEARLFIMTARRLAEGRPVTRDALAALAEREGLTGNEAEESLQWLSERDEEGSIVGLGGLSLNEWGHRFRVDGRDFTTWCALDTLYLPRVLDRWALATSSDPQSGEELRVRIGPDGEVEAPAGAVISIVVPQIDHKSLESAEQIWTAFCNYSLYFASEANGRAWFEGKHVTPYFLPIADGARLALDWLSPVTRKL